MTLIGIIACLVIGFVAGFAVATRIFESGNN
jgi:uncharacterized protein YneF (UPF0154 family)